MAKSDNKFAYESMQDTETIVAQLNALAEGLASGQLRLASGEHELLLEPRDLLRLRVRAQRGTYRSRLVLKISWREPAEHEASAPLAIEAGPAQE